MSGEEGFVEVESTAETVDEAKRSALRELCRRIPDLAQDSVAFEVLSPGERGLLGVGFSPARVRAVARTQPGPPPPAPDSAAAALQQLLLQVAQALGVTASVRVSDTQPGLLGLFEGTDLGPLIGRHGQTLDAIEAIAQATVDRTGAQQGGVEVDAGGYRVRRRASLERESARAAREASRTGLAQALAPMPPRDRRHVHRYLQDRADVETASEGEEPNRHVVIRPTRR